MRLAVFTLLLATLALRCAEENNSSIRFPAPQIPAPPSIDSASYAMGQHTSRLEDMANRLTDVERDLKNVGKDVQRINVVGSILLSIFTVVVAPVIIYRIQKKLDTTATHAPKALSHE